MISSLIAAVTATIIYYILMKFISQSIISTQDAEHFAKQMLRKLGTDTNVLMMEVGEPTD